MNIRKYSNFILVSALLISILGLNLTTSKINEKSQELIGVKVDFIPSSLSNITEDSDSVILGVPEEEPSIIQYKDVTFYLTKVNVQKNYYGEELESFTLLQTYAHEDPIVVPNEPSVLFLSKYSGPITDDSNVYVCTGLGYGQYSIETNNISQTLNRQYSIETNNISPILYGQYSIETNNISPVLKDSNSHNIIKDYQTLNSLEDALYDINSSIDLIE